jgi:hypothetical protein
VQSSSPAKSSPLLTFREPLVKSSGLTCVKHSLNLIGRKQKPISGHETMKTITCKFCKERQSHVSISRRHTQQWRHVCTSHTSVLKCGWHFDTLLPKYACKINSDWIITITVGVFARARVKLMTCMYTRFHWGFHQGSVPEAWKAYWYRNLIWEVEFAYKWKYFWRTRLPWKRGLQACTFHVHHLQIPYSRSESTIFEYLRKTKCTWL